MVDRRQFDVAFFAPWIGPLIAERPGTSAGGAETQMLMVARGLAGRGLRVALVVFADGGELPRESGGVGVVQVPRPRLRSPLLRPVERAARIVGVVARLRTDVLVQRIAGPETGLVGLIAKARRRRFVYSSANVVDFDYAKLGGGRVKVWLYHLGIRLADTVVVQTPEQAQLCKRRFGRDAVVIKSVAERAPAAPRAPEAFLWVGRTDWYKHPEAFIELARAVPEARFWMVPMPMDDEGRLRMQRLSEQAAALPNLEVLDPRPRKELVELIPAAVAIVNTSDYEGMPNVFLEGWARGVPALSLTHDPDGVVEREGLGGFAGGSARRLAELARDLWEKRNDQAALSERCTGYVEREHSSEAVVERWLAALDFDQPAGFSTSATTLP